MRSASEESLILVTGASGHIGSELCRILRTTRHKILAVDLDPIPAQDVIVCDLRLKNAVSQLFRARPIRTVIHLAGILPSAFRSDPLTGAEVNLNGSVELIRQAVNAHVKRFIFASSIGVYGSSPTTPLTESNPAAPDEPYGGSKRAVELVGETLASGRAFEFVSLRIARVIGPGIKRTSSPWRSQIFEPPLGVDPIRIPFAPEAKLSLVHVQDVARMLVTLVDAVEIGSLVYNTPVEIWETRHLKEVIEAAVGVRVELGDSGVHGGPTCDGDRFTREFRFQLRGLRDHLSDSRRTTGRFRRRSVPNSP
ncbi:MAG TPA: NAD(P)-dependent oxidoreductase [Terriglobales bacterium]|jgi:nucleoside-diphosphate-sugar epimerase|nr:NAD(P)-dependent oxidoreductase [Terriglobales bacterium]